MAVEVAHSERASSLVAKHRLIADHRTIVSRPLQSLMGGQFSNLSKCNPNLKLASEACWRNGRMATSKEFDVPFKSIAVAGPLACCLSNDTVDV